MCENGKLTSSESMSNSEESDDEPDVKKRYDSATSADSSCYVSLFHDNSEERKEKREKQVRGPLSHRITEKRRRDRMNSHMAELSRLLPSSSLKQGQGMIEKTEIVALAIQHIRYLHSLNSPRVSVATEASEASIPAASARHTYRKGIADCANEVLCFLHEDLALDVTNVCQRMLMHLQHFEKKMLQTDAHLVHDGTETRSSTNFTGTSPINSNCSESDTEGQSRPNASSVDSGFTTKPSETSSSDSSSSSVTRSFRKEIKSSFSMNSFSENSDEGQSTNNHSRVTHISCSGPVPTLLSGGRCCHEYQVPGFVLHPSGNHYVPLALSQSVVMDALGPYVSQFKSQASVAVPCHPISIPVCFVGASMQTSSQLVHAGSSCV